MQLRAVISAPRLIDVSAENNRDNQFRPGRLWISLRFGHAQIEMGAPTCVVQCQTTLAQTRLACRWPKWGSPWLFSRRHTEQRKNGMKRPLLNKASTT